MQRIVVTNAKGGCGKSTVATNLAAQLAGRGPVSLFDHDPQGSSMHWLKLRGVRKPSIHGVAAHRRHNGGVTRTFQLRTPPDTRFMVCDTPAGVAGAELAQLVQQADVIVIPVLPSPIDIHAATHFVRDLLLVGRARAYNVSIGVVANRVRKNTVMYQALRQFLRTLNITFITALRDTQSYAKAAEQGLGVHELDGETNQRDRAQWQPLLDWLPGFAPQQAEPAPADTRADDATSLALAATHAWGKF